MPTFMVISKHTPESCWMFNVKTRQIHVNLIKNLESLLKKHQTTMLGCWFDLPGHTLYEVYDCPSLEAMQKLIIEPEIAAWSSFNSIEIKLMTTVDDVSKILQV
jgi:hypothetical protein